MLSTEYIVLYIYIYIYVFEWDIFLSELWFDIYDFRQIDHVLTLIHRIFISIVLLISNKGLLQIYFNTEYMIFIYMLESDIFFVRNYDFIYMIMNNLTMNWFWYPANGGYSLVL